MNRKEIMRNALSTLYTFKKFYHFCFVKFA
jgi:hypothetical protein